MITTSSIQEQVPKSFPCKSQLQALLTKYDSLKGIRRRLFGDTDGISQLRNFVNQRLQVKNPLDELNANEIKELLIILKDRFTRIKDTSRSYRTSKTKLTNVIYANLANLISIDNSPILALVQAYQNDYDTKGGPLIELTDPFLFVTTSGYAFSMLELLEHIKQTESVSYPIPGKSLKESKPFTEDDLLNLNKIPFIASEILSIQEKYATYKNQETLTGDPLYFYPKSRLFITEDNFCFLVDDIIQIMQAQKLLTNPYTRLEFSENDIMKLMSMPDVKSAAFMVQAKQTYCASKISPLTINKLIELSESFLITHEEELHNKAYWKFNDYYQSINDIEKAALNDYWIEGWESISLVRNRRVHGMRAIKFLELYREFDTSCSFIGSIVKMVIQLKTDAVFNITHADGLQIIDNIRHHTDLNHSAFVTDTSVTSESLAL